MAALAVLAPALGTAAAVPFFAVAGLAFFGVRDGEWFETLALPGDREAERLYGLVSFAVAAGGLALFASLPRAPLPYEAFAAATLAVGAGRFGRTLVSRRTTDEFPLVAGYVAAGTVAALAGQIAVRLQTGAAVDAATVPLLVFLAAAAALTAALVRSLVFARDAHITTILVAFVVWGFLTLDPTVSAPLIAVGLAVTGALGYVSFAIGTASVAGMLTGVVAALLAVVLGGVGWFLTLMSFYAVGGLASKYRFDEKADRGVAQENEGARGTGNVLANSAVALAAVVGYAAAPHAAIPAAPFGAAFAGATATAMADTLSSEIGGLYDGPRLVTTLRRVEPGTDGAITWQGELAGLTGALLVGALAAGGGPVLDPVVSGGVAAGAVVLAAGFAGMTVDSILGALIEGERVGNQAVNFLATLAGSVVAVALLTVV
ncbi:TIGR00297 family protein [Halorubrum ejinorense]|uniref:TIGR00297 family protein n=1 Tax=Halorubrum ejinorense TaxID=425309 RepID=A0AAV3SVB0_9EURY